MIDYSDQSLNKSVILIGYGGHGFVAADILLQNNFTILGYCENEEKKNNPYHLTYFGTEAECFNKWEDADTQFSFFISIGNFVIRKKIFDYLIFKNCSIINAIHPTAVVANLNTIGKGTMIAANATINPLCEIGNGVICNTSSSIDHECKIGNFTHICPGTVLCGNVVVGNNTFIGANSVVSPGITICDDVVIGAGSTIIKNITHPGTYVGTPVKRIK